MFAGLIYPIGSHWVFGGGWLQNNLGMQDFAGSTAVHLIGATGALAVLLLLGPRRGKYDTDGTPRAIPGHNMPLFGLGVLILWLGWFGFNAGSTLGALDGRFPEVAHGHAAGRRRRRARLDRSPPTGRPRRSTSAWPATARSARSSASPPASGYVEPWAGVIIGAIAGVIVPLGVYAIDKKIDDPVGALTAHGLCGVWGTLACGLFTSPRLAEYNAFGEGGLLYTGSFGQLGTQALGVVTVFAFVFVALVPHLLRDQEDLRPARLGRGGGSRPRHHRARHVRLPGAVHPGAGAHRLRDGTARVARHPVARPSHPERGAAT